LHFVKSAIHIPPCTRFRYFEVETLENKADATIYIGIVEATDPFIQNPGSIEEFSG